MAFPRALVLCFLLSSALGGGLFAASGTIGSAGSSSFRACYLTPENPSQGNYAVLYKGLAVEIIGGSASTRWKIRVPVGSRKVVPADGWLGASDPRGTGWVSPRFVTLDAAPPVAGDPGGATGPGSGDQGSGAADLFGTGEGGGTLSGGDLGDGGVGAGQVPTGGASSGVYYVFAGMGEDEGWFVSLARNAPIAGEPNRVWQYVRRDIQETGKRCEGVVVVKVASPANVMRILQDGMVPPGGPTPVPSGNQRVPIYGFEQLQPSNRSILGLNFISHSGSDGPLIDYHDGRGKQLHWQFFNADFNMAGRGRSSASFHDRLVHGARITLCGCNAGSCQYYDGKTPSLSHFLASIYQKKNVLVRGKHDFGSPNSTDRHFAVFGRHSDGLIRRLKPTTKQYRMLIGVPTNRYDEFRVPFSSQAERDALTNYYAERDITVRVEGQSVVVRSPQWLRGKWMDETTDKDNLIEAVIEGMASRRLEAPTIESLQAMMGRSDPAALAEARRMMPRLQALYDDIVFQAMVEVSRDPRTGVVDTHDFRLWLHVYFGDLNQEQRREARNHIPLRACLCRNPALTQLFASE